MRRVSDLVGTTIVTAESGEKIGRTVDLLLSPAGTRVVAIVIGGVLGGEQVLAFEDVQIFGREVVLARSQQCVMAPRRWEERGIGTWRTSTLKNKLVVRRDGREVGTIADIWINQYTGEVDAYDIADRAFARVILRHTVLPRAGDLTLTPDVIIVSSEAADRLEANDGEVANAGNHRH